MSLEEGAPCGGMCEPPSAGFLLFGAAAGAAKGGGAAFGPWRLCGFHGWRHSHRGGQTGAGLLKPDAAVRPWIAVLGLPQWVGASMSGSLAAMGLPEKFLLGQARSFFTWHERFAQRCSLEQFFGVGKGVTMKEGFHTTLMFCPQGCPSDKIFAGQGVWTRQMVFTCY